MSPHKAEESVVICVSIGIYFARKIVSWEICWREKGDIPEGRQGCFAKTWSWFNDEGVEVAIREWIGHAGESRFPTLNVEGRWFADGSL